MLPIVEILSEGEPPLRWFVARVEAVHHGPPSSLDLVIGDLGDPACARMYEARYLQTYSPAVGDVVQILTHSSTGTLVLGKVAP